MKSESKTVKEYINSLPEERKEAFIKLRHTILKNIPKGFKEEINYGMVGYVVPQEIYPSGYHVNPKLPLPFINIANQKNSINFYHMAIYSMSNLQEWYIDEYSKFSKYKVDMGKSCIRYKNINQIPYEIIEKLVSKMSVKEWIELYEEKIKK